MKDFSLCLESVTNKPEPLFSDVSDPTFVIKLQIPRGSSQGPFEKLWWWTAGPVAPSAVYTTQFHDTE